MRTAVLRRCLDHALRLNYRHPETGNGYHHFTFIVQDNSVLGYGFNRGGGCKPFYGYKAHQKLHSENMAYVRNRGLLNKRKPFDIVNVRLTKKGDVRISKPCECCVTFLSGLGCATCWFTTGIANYPWAKLKL